MEANFLIQNSCIPSCPGVFQFHIFFSVFFSSSMRISALGPSLSPSSSLVIPFIHTAFSLCYFGYHIFVQNCSVSLLLECFCVMPSQVFIEFSFRYVLFCLYCFTLCQYLSTLRSFARTFWFISSSCSVFSRVVFSILFSYIQGPFSYDFGLFS